MARSGIWYSKNIFIDDSIIQAPKTFRRCENVHLKDVFLPNASETLWNCNSIQLENCQAEGDYFGKNSENITLNHVTINGNYAFDGGKNIKVYDSKLLSKDAFWNCENVTVYNSTIIGEYIGWNAKNLTFIDCIIESEQGFCYIDNLVIKNSKIINSELIFEFSTVDVESLTTLISIKNPISGKIIAPDIKEIILDSNHKNLEICYTNKCNIA